MTKKYYTPAEAGKLIGACARSVCRACAYLGIPKVGVSWVITDANLGPLRASIRAAAGRPPEKERKKVKKNKNNT
jgi:hypothetical protein